MGKFIVIKNADFSNVSVEVVTPMTLDISITPDGSVTISDNAATAIYYTVDGSTPTTSSTQYSGAFNVSSGTTVKAISLYATGRTSAVASKEYLDEIDISSLFTWTKRTGIVADSSLPDYGEEFTTDLEKYSACDFVSISGYSSLYITCINIRSNAPTTMGLCFYDSSKKVILGKTFPTHNTEASYNYEENIKIPSNASYVRTCYLNNDTPFVCLAKIY